MSAINSFIKCPICSDELKEPVQLECKHLFHFDCIKRWIKKNEETCPLDRLPINVQRIIDLSVYQQFSIEQNALKLVKEMLLTNSEDSQQKDQHFADVRLLTELSTLNSCFLHAERDPLNNKLKLKRPKIAECSEKIVDYVKTHADFAPPQIKQKYAILHHFLQFLQNKKYDQSEEELQAFFDEIPKLINSKALGDVCAALEIEYREKNELAAGYYLLWLIKHSTTSHFEIPRFENFDVSTVKNVLLELINSDPTQIPIPFLDLCYNCHVQNNLLFAVLLDPSAFSNFFEATCQRMKNVSIDEWPENLKVAVNLLLQNVSDVSKILIINAIASSSDKNTAIIGNNLFYQLLLLLNPDEKKLVAEKLASSSDSDTAQIGKLLLIVLNSANRSSSLLILHS